MAYRKCMLGEKVRCYPEIARDEIITILTSNGGNITQAAEIFDVHRVTLRRWINRLGLEQFVDDARNGLINRKRPNSRR